MNVLRFAVTVLWFGKASSAEYKGEFYASMGVRVVPRRLLREEPSLLAFCASVPSLCCAVLAVPRANLG